ncbi:MAG: WYL domain-containing protein [Nostocoides sp.]
MEASAARRRVVVGYRSGSGKEWEAEVDLWAVVVRHGYWYLLCHSHPADAIRTYRVDRIGTVQVPAQPFTPPPDLDPVASLEENLGAGWEFASRVVFDAAYEEVEHWVAAPMGRLTAMADGRCELVGTTSSPMMYVQEWLAPIPFPFHIEQGPELRWATEQLLERLNRSIAGE